MKNEQRELIRAFDRKYLHECHNNGLYTLVTGLLSFLAVIFMMIPWQEMKYEETSYGLWTAVLFFMVQPAAVYLSKYFLFKEDGKDSRLADKLLYLPVDRKEIRIVRFLELIKFQAKLFVASLAVQLLITWFASSYRIEPGNILYVVCVAYIAPVLLNAVYIFLQTGWKTER